MSTDPKEIIPFLCHLQGFSKYYYSHYLNQGYNYTVVISWNILKFDICMAIEERIQFQVEKLNKLLQNRVFN